MNTPQSTLPTTLELANAFIAGLAERLTGSQLNDYRVQWTASDTSVAEYLGPVEFQDDAGTWHIFELLTLPGRVLFGGACNTGFLESGYILRADGESLDGTLAELLADLGTYYNDGPQYVSRIVCNQRM